LPLNCLTSAICSKRGRVREIESIKTVSDLIAPVSGTVSAVNAELEDHPSLVNEDPYHEGWLVELELSDKNEIEDLMDPDEYEEFAGE